MLQINRVPEALFDKIARTTKAKVFLLLTLQVLLLQDATPLCSCGA